MHADRELRTEQRIREETTMDMARQHTLMQEGWEAVWERSRAGRHTVVVGPHTLPPAACSALPVTALTIARRSSWSVARTPF